MNFGPWVRLVCFHLPYLEKRKGKLVAKLDYILKEIKIVEQQIERAKRNSEGGDMKSPKTTE